jgi:amino acid permease
MYQTNMPMIYSELKDKNYQRMSRVLIYGMIIACLTYTITGIFGYLTFVNHPEDLMTENILDAPYDNKAISFGLFSQFFSILTS